MCVCVCFVVVCRWKSNRVREKTEDELTSTLEDLYIFSSFSFPLLTLPPYLRFFFELEEESKVTNRHENSGTEKRIERERKKEREREREIARKRE